MVLSRLSISLTVSLTFRSKVSQYCLSNERETESFHTALVDCHRAVTVCHPDVSCSNAESSRVIFRRRRQCQLILYENPMRMLSYAQTSGGTSYISSRSRIGLSALGYRRWSELSELSSSIPCLERLRQASSNTREGFEPSSARREYALPMLE